MVRTNASAMPFDCGLSMGVVRGLRLISRAKRRVTILMSDCRATTGADAIPVARGLDELCVIAPTDDVDDAAEFAKAVGAQLATVDEPSDIPAAFLKVLER